MRPRTTSVELVGDSRQGDNAAVNELLSRYWPRMLRVVRIKMGASLRRRIDPEDIVQETAIIACAKIDQLDVHTSAGILRWLARIAENVIQNKLRTIRALKRDPDRETPIADGSDGPAGVVLQATTPTPSQEFSRAEMSELVDTCIAQLEPEAFREVILMRDFCQMDWEEIRVELERPTVDAVRELHRRACDKLAEKVGPHGIGAD